MKGLRKILHIKKPYWSRVSNKKLLERAKAKLNGELENKEFKRFPTRLIERQITLYAHIVRADEDDPMKNISSQNKGKINQTLEG